MVTFTREASFTNNAGSQTGGSPNSGENIGKPESAATYELISKPVETLAHWLPVSHQLMDDAPAFPSVHFRAIDFMASSWPKKLSSSAGTGRTINSMA